MLDLRRGLIKWEIFTVGLSRPILPKRPY
uniref:Uncharacterized protein n=1 Tax=Arundo donax TaxID=35708 RepID=A0A0A9EWT1_ARUDO